MKEYDAKVRLNEEDGGKTGELDIMLKPPYDKGYFKGVTYGIEFKDPVFEAEKKSGWIPCSERLPNTNGIYIVTRIIEAHFIEDVSYFDGSNTWHADNRINHGRDYLKDVVAWMELPNPYEMGE